MVIGVVKLEMHIFVNKTWSYDRSVTWLDGYGQLDLSQTLLKLMANALTKVDINLKKKKKRDYMINESRDSMD